MQSVYSKETFIFDSKTGILLKQHNMSVPRQAHALCRIGHYIYCSGGLNTRILKSCERFDLRINRWYQDMPDMVTEKFSMTGIVVNNTWLYNFGGADLYMQD